MAESSEQQIPKKVISESEELPKAIVRRVVKDKLSQISADFDISLHRDSLQAFSESSRIFIHCLSAAANDICKESNRKTINVEDVFKALEEIEFHHFIEPLRASLEGFRQKKSGSSKAKDTNKKLKWKEAPTETEGSNKRHEVISTGDSSNNNNIPEITQNVDE